MKWLHRLRKNERGNVLYIAAASMPLLVGAAAMGIDTIQLSLWKRQLQRAADSSAIAAAYAMAQEADPEAAVTRDLARNNYITVDDDEVVPGAFGAFTQAVTVTLDSQRELTFMGMFLDTQPNLEATATAAVVAAGEFCMISLYDGDEETGIDVSGNAEIRLGCGVSTNAGGDNAIVATGSSLVDASPIAAVGSLNPSSNYGPNTKLLPYSMKQMDPFSSVPNPSSSPCVPGTQLKGGTTTTGGGCYASMNVKNGETLTLAPGTYTFTGDLDIKGTVKHTAGTTGVTLVMTGPTTAGGGVNAGDLKMTSDGSLQLSAPETGDYAGIVLYRDRRADHAEQTVNGHSSSAIQGAIYMPSSNIKMNGSADMSSQCLQLIGYVLKINGGTDILNTCPENSASQAIKRTVVRLVA